MKTFQYHLKATNSENVGEIEAENEAAALQQLNDIYAPNDPVTGKPHAGIEITIIDKRQFKKDQERIAAERKAAAES